MKNLAQKLIKIVFRMGAGASGYIAILFDVTLPFVPMAIFCIFSLFAGMLVWRLPETMDIPLPETMWDAVTMLRTDGGKEKDSPGSSEKETLTKGKQAEHARIIEEIKNKQ